MAYHPFRDFGLKVVAVILAVMLWLSVGDEPVVERGLDVPLAFENIPLGLKIVDDPPNTVRVRVRGSSSVVSRLESGEVVAVLDLVDERAGQQLFDMFADRIVVPIGVEVSNIVPATVTLTLEADVVPAHVEKTIHGVTLHLRDSAGSRRASVESDRVDIGFRGSRELMLEVRPDTVQAFIDLKVLAGQPAGHYNLPVAVESIDGLSITHIDPPSVQIVLH